MAYLNTHARTTSPTGNDTFQPAGRMPTLFGVFVGFVKDATDVQRNGRLMVWIPELGSAPENKEGWIIVNYCSPFAGATNVETISKTNPESFDTTQTSYGMWMVPPDINNQVLIMFINGDPSRGIWIGSLFNQFMNNMVPAMAADAKSYQYPGKKVPVAEYNKWDTKITQPDRALKPYQKTKFKGIGNQGLVADSARGTTTSSARREAPSNVFGIITPGPPINDNVSAGDIRRKGGSSFVMDDGTGSEYVQLTTKTGAQIKIDETNGFIYLINRDGTAWVQMDQKGNIDIFGATNISMRSQRDINFRADRNINFEAGQNIFLKAAKDTKQTTTSFTYDVNNIPKPSTIEQWSYVGEGNGTGGNIVMQSLNNWHSTAKNSTYLTVKENNMNLSIGNAFNLTTRNGGQEFNSKQGVKITTDAAFDLAATGNIRVGSKGVVSLVGTEGIVFCTDANLDLKAGQSIQEAAGDSILLTASTTGIDSVLTVTGTANLLAQYANVASALGAVSPSTAPSANPAAAEGALSSGFARAAEVKPLNDKINILATWKDPESKFRRNSESLQTTVSRFPTYEPCPEHEKFSISTIAGYTPNITVDDKTYEGSAGKGNSASASPPPAVAPGANNTSVVGDPSSDNAISNDFNMNAFRCQLIIHEGLKNKSYLDSLGLLTGGIGHLLRSNEISLFPVGTPISDTQIESWYVQDSTSSVKIAISLLGDTWGDLSGIRKRACADLAYNLGKARFSQFTNFLSYMKKEDYNNAGVELRNSKWYTQVGKRGPNIVTMIVQNIDPNGCDKKFPE